MQFLLIAGLLFFPLPLFAANVVDFGQLSLSAEPATVAQVTIDLGRESRRRVEASGQLVPQPLLDESDPLDEGLRHFLLSVAFVDEQTGETINRGQVAARAFGPDKGLPQTVRLKAEKETQWTCLLTLKTSGETMIKVGSKLVDGKKRIYRFFYNPLVIDSPGAIPEIIPAE